MGRAEAKEWGLSNAEFRLHDAANLADVGTFDLVTTFDAVHDQADPVAMVAGVFDMVKPGGHWLCVDIQASSHVGENIAHPLGTSFYSVSCAHCMTVSLAHRGARRSRCDVGRAGRTENVHRRRIRRSEDPQRRRRRRRTTTTSAANPDLDPRGPLIPALEPHRTPRTPAARRAALWAEERKRCKWLAKAP